MYRIKEVSRRTGVLTHTLRYWEKEFEGVLLPSRSQGKHRFYSEEDVDRVETIKRLLKEDGYSIQGARKYLEMRANGHTGGNGNGNGHSNGNGNGHAHANGDGNGNGHSNGNGHVVGAELPESLVDRIASAVAQRVANMIREGDEKLDKASGDALLIPAADAPLAR